jgi:hypothetical protein
MPSLQKFNIDALLFQLPQNMKSNKHQFHKLTTHRLNTPTAAIIQCPLQYSIDCLQTEVTADATGTQSISQFLRTHSLQIALAVRHLTH